MTAPIAPRAGSPRHPLMSSSRDSPFSFSPDLRSILGSPDSLNAAFRGAFWVLLDADSGVARATRPCSDGLLGAGVCVLAGSHIPAGEPVGFLGGHLFLGSRAAGSRDVALPIFQAHGVDLRAAVDGAAQSARFPSGVAAALYEHTCTDASVTGDWWLGGPVPCLVARTTRPLSQFDRLRWNRDEISAVGYTSSQAEARVWRRAGHRTRRCTCNAPRDCPLDRFICLAAETAPSDDSD